MSRSNKLNNLYLDLSEIIIKILVLGNVINIKSNNTIALLKYLNIRLANMQHTCFLCTSEAEETDLLHLKVATVIRKYLKIQQPS